MKNIILIYPQPDAKKSYRFGYSMLLLYVASTLRNAGYSVSLNDYSVVRYDFNELRAQLLPDSIVIMEIDAFPLKRSLNIRCATTIANDVKNFKNSIPVIAIGKQCTLFHQELAFADITVSGDCEISILDIINQLDGNKKVCKFYDAGSLNQLHKLPLPAYDLLDEEQVCGKTLDTDMNLAPSALLETSRGCPGKCTFCQRKGWCEKVSTMPLDTVRKNFRYLLDEKIINFWITDENFSGNINHATEVLKMFTNEAQGREVRICISSWVHITEAFLSLAKQAGVSVISLGIESITAENQDFYNKHHDPVIVKRMLKAANDVGIFTVGNFIIGSPYDTYETIEENLQYAIESELDQVNVKNLDYMMGAELYENLPEEQKKEIHFFSCSERGICNFSRDELRNIAKSFSGRFNETRVEKLQQKICRFGTPYVLR